VEIVDIFEEHNNNKHTSRSKRHFTKACHKGMSYRHKFNGMYKRHVVGTLNENVKKRHEKMACIKLHVTKAYQKSMLSKGIPLRHFEKARFERHVL
jgi:hypothetical protein